MYEYIENEFAEFWIKDDILFFVYKAGVTIDLQAAIKIVEDRIKLQNGEEMSVLCDVRGVHRINKEARDYLAIEGSVLIKAVAFMASPPKLSAMSNFYDRVCTPPVPIKIFTGKDEALVYLNALHPIH